MVKKLFSFCHIFFIHFLIIFDIIILNYSFKMGCVVENILTILTLHMNNNIGYLLQRGMCLL